MVLITCSQIDPKAAGVWEPRSYLFFPLHLYWFQRGFADVSDVGSRLGGSEGGLGSVRFGHREQVRLGDVGVGPRLCCGEVSTGQLGPLILLNHLHILSICLTITTLSEVEFSFLFTQTYFFVAGTHPRCCRMNRFMVGVHDRGVGVWVSAVWSCNILASSALKKFWFRIHHWIDNALPGVKM